MVVKPINPDVFREPRHDPIITAINMCIKDRWYNGAAIFRLSQINARLRDMCRAEVDHNTLERYLDEFVDAGWSVDAEPLPNPVFTFTPQEDVCQDK